MIDVRIFDVQIMSWCKFCEYLPPKKDTKEFKRYTSRVFGRALFEVGALSS